MQQINPPSYDLILPGRGSGGLATARLVLSPGAYILLVEKEHLRGGCLHGSYAPGKSLVRVAGSFYQMQLIQKSSGGDR